MTLDTNYLNVVKPTLPRNANIHAKEYKLYLPSKEELKQKLMEWSKEEGGVDENGAD